MKNQTNFYASRAAVWSCAALLMLAGCGKKDKKSDSAPAKPVVVETSMTEVSNQDGQAKFRYTSNIKDAKFKCKIEFEGQPLAEWQACAADGISFQIPDGASFTFQVKAVGPDGSESEPFTYKSPSQGSSTQGTSTQGQQLQLSVEILGKEQIQGSIYNQRTLQVQFATKGAEFNPNEIRYECQRENETAYRRCPAGNEYDFGQLVDGTQYGLSVRAVHDQTKTISTEDTIQFKVQLSRLTVSGGEKLVNQTTGSVNLGFVGIPDGSQIVCKLNGSQAIDCSPINLDTIPSGSHRLEISAIDGSGAQIATAEPINFCAKRCVVEPMVQFFQIGSFYNFLVPDDMHVTEYSSSKTFNSQLNFYRVTANSDPFYIGNYDCSGIFDRFVTASAPSGQPYDYCHTTPTGDIYKWLTDFRLANNHIEVATNEEQVTPNNHERIMINVFDRDYEYMRGRSRFEQLCLNRNGSITKTPYQIPFVQDFWNDPTRVNRAEFWMCDVQLAGGNNNGFPQVEQWRVGGFFISQDGNDMPDFSCSIGCAPIVNPNLLEVVYMVRPNGNNWTPAFFARTAQLRFLEFLTESVPN